MMPVKKTILFFIATIIILSLAAACKGTPSDNVTAEPTLAFYTPVPQFTNTPSSSPTPTPTPDPVQFLEQGISLLTQQDYVNAISMFNEAILYGPDLSEAYYGRGIAYQNMGSYEQALEDLDKAIEIDPDYVAALTARGYVNYTLELSEYALKDFNRAIELDPTYADAFMGRATLQKGAWLPQAVIADLEVYLALVPDTENREEINETIEYLQNEIIHIQGAAMGLPFFDDFSTATKGWFSSIPTDKLSGGLYYFAEGKVGIQVYNPESVYWIQPGKQFTDVVVEVDVTKIAGSDNNAYGVFCRYISYKNFYAFLISSDGYAGIARPVNDVLTDIGAMRMEEAVKLGDGTNHIRAICSGDLLKLYVNDEFVGVWVDNTISYGDVGVIAASLDNEKGTEVLFDNFRVSSVPFNP